MLKLCFSLIFMCLSSFVFAQKIAGEMNLLSSIVSTPDYQTDRTRVSYVMKRCSALYTVTGLVMMEKMGESKLGKEMTELGAIYADGSMQLDMAIQKSRNPKVNMTIEDWQKTTIDMINRISNIYITDMKNSSDRTGDFFSSAYKSDMNICKDLSKYTKANK